jgi:hypothetical protein
MTSAAEHLEIAIRYLTAAVAQNWSDTARQALISVGRAEAALGPESLLTAPSVASEREALRAAAASTGELVRQAALTIDSLALEPDDEDALEEALLARTGYQDLLDMGTWPSPPLPAFDLTEVDRELATVVTKASPPRPAGIPPPHTWWHPDSP